MGLVLWFAAIGLQLAGWWPPPRPPAWEAGSRNPWLGPGEEPGGPERRHLLARSRGVGARSPSRRSPRIRSRSPVARPRVRRRKKETAAVAFPVIRRRCTNCWGVVQLGPWPKCGCPQPEPRRGPLASPVRNARGGVAFRDLFAAAAAAARGAPAPGARRGSRPAPGPPGPRRVGAPGGWRPRSRCRPRRAPGAPACQRRGRQVHPLRGRARRPQGGSWQGASARAALGASGGPAGGGRLRHRCTVEVVWLHSRLYVGCPEETRVCGLARCVGAGRLDAGALLDPAFEFDVTRTSDPLYHAHGA